jgi:hypothetical protein
LELLGLLERLWEEDIPAGFLDTNCESQHKSKISTYRDNGTPTLDFENLESDAGL